MSNETNESVDDESEELTNECTESLLMNKNCKYFHHEPFYTPNNYDIYFDYNSIPSNIKVESAHDLQKRLQRTMPLTKIIHVNLEKEALPQMNMVHMRTDIRLKFKKHVGDRSDGTWIVKDVEKSLFTGR